MDQYSCLQNSPENRNIIGNKVHCLLFKNIIIPNQQFKPICIYLHLMVVVSDKIPFLENNHSILISQICNKFEKAYRMCDN